jgi:hypothetical protein
VSRVWLNVAAALEVDGEGSDLTSARLPCAVFNFYEPLHYFQNNSGFQTWELSPQFAVRSWAYVLLHWPFAHIGPQVLNLSKVSPDTFGGDEDIADSTPSQRQAFFALRLFLGAICSFCEARFMRTIAETINDRVARYTFFMLLLSAGMWSASVCECMHRSTGISSRHFDAAGRIDSSPIVSF